MSEHPQTPDDRDPESSEPGSGSGEPPRRPMGFGSGSTGGSTGGSDGGGSDGDMPADPFEGEDLPDDLSRDLAAADRSGGSHVSDKGSDDDSDDEADELDLGELGAMVQGLLGGLGGSGKPGEMPDLGALMRQLNESGQLPDMEELMKGLMGGQGGAGMPDLNELLRAFGATPPAGGGTGGTMGFGGSGPASGSAASNPAMGQFAVLQQQLAQMFSAQSPQSRAEMATDIARKTVAAGDKDAVVTAAQSRAVEDAVRVAQLWLDPVTSLDSVAGQGKAWSRAEWVEATMPTWSRLVEPVSTGVTAAVAAALKTQMGRLGDELKSNGVSSDDLPQTPGFDLGALMDQVAPMMEKMSGSMFSAQLGHGVGALAADLLSATEVGLPLLDSQDVALLPANVAEFTAGLSVEESQVRLYLAVREAARTRLFAQVPWLGAQLEAAVRDYARNITIDTDAIEEQIRSMDPGQGAESLASMQEALQHKLFAPTPTPEQRAALTRLETSLALVEGWVDLVTEQATRPHLPQADALGEAMRRRRAGGPAQKTFSGLVGLELQPRRLRDARNLWAALEDAGGVEFRDAPWSHPDIAPRAEDLDDPLGYVEKRRAGGSGGGSGDDIDSALEALLRDPGEGDADPKGE